MLNQLMRLLKLKISFAPPLNEFRSFPSPAPIGGIGNYIWKVKGKFLEMPLFSYDRFQVIILVCILLSPTFT